VEIFDSENCWRCEIRKTRKEKLNLSSWMLWTSALNGMCNVLTA
jgi:hypothetical protein